MQGTLGARLEDLLPHHSTDLPDQGQYRLALDQLGSPVEWGAMTWEEAGVPEHLSGPT